MTFKVLVLVVEQFLTYIFIPFWFCYKFIQVTACKKLTY